MFFLVSRVKPVKNKFKFNFGLLNFQGGGPTYHEKDSPFPIAHVKSFILRFTPNQNEDLLNRRSSRVSCFIAGFWFQAFKRRQFDGGFHTTRGGPLAGFNSNSW